MPCGIGAFCLCCKTHYSIPVVSFVPGASWMSFPLFYVTVVLLLHVPMLFLGVGWSGFVRGLASSPARRLDGAKLGSRRAGLKPPYLVDNIEYCPFSSKFLLFSLPRDTISYSSELSI